MIKKIFPSSSMMYRSNQDLKKALKDFVCKLDDLPRDKNYEPLNTSEVGMEFKYIAERYLLDYAALEEDTMLATGGASRLGAMENRLTEYHESVLSKIPIDVTVEQGMVTITIYSYLNKKDYLSAALYHNLDHQLQAKLNHIKNSESLYGLIGTKYKMELLRYVRNGLSSSTVCDPSNIEVSYLINTICCNFGISDAYNNMVEYTVKSIEVEKKQDEKTAIIVTSL